MVEIETAQAVRTFVPDLAAIAQMGCRAVIVTAASDDPSLDFVSRFFGPNVRARFDFYPSRLHVSLLR
jgi:predicted PhzF superfamily epimerase YddE/YHI9